MTQIENIPFSRPYIKKEEEEAVLHVLRSGWLTTGQETIAFEKEFAEFFGEKDITALAVNSATSGLHLALEACGIKSGDVVLVPSYTFTATAEAVHYLQADVAFVDVAPDTFHIDVNSLEKAMKNIKWGRVKAIIPVHYAGFARNMPEILNFAKKYDLKVIEDSAHSFPSQLKDGSWAGTLGDVGVFSFYANKTITTGEGGMVVSRNPAIIERIKITRSHGIDKSVWNRYIDNRATWYYQVVEMGYKYNITDVLATIGRVQLSRAMDLLKMREEIAFLYDEAFRGDEYFTIPDTGTGDARHIYPIRLNLDKLSISRDEFIEKVKSEGIGVSVHFIPLHTMPYYKNRYSLQDNDFPETIKSFNRVISIPIWAGMEKSHIDRVISVFKTIARQRA